MSKNKICGIYKIVNKVNGKIYIGQSVDIKKRWKLHEYNSKYDYKKNHLYSAIRKYGIDNFTFSVICEVPENILDVYEISYIKYYETTDRMKGYNKKSGGANGRHSDETKMKISKELVGIKRGPRSEEHKQNLSDALKGRSAHNKGKPMSDEQKKKISITSKAQLGKKRGPYKKRV